ncbi:hypothetical protein KRR38_18235 [Novosphingobium sp. G106]|uniref:spike base protein, RCAP_Rcc01079 family n=1 Tax=Novosphingobium sp. G106 TaxID=2849500 RepID=UPI001C2D789E|nr:hypothetical protein [Novosphingobium sp. G106]MBV1689566.1 hypothetical protein [Novosphingobium sp. G106]
MSFDPFANNARAAVDPARTAFAIVPHDVNELPMLPRAIYVGTGGTITLRAADSGADVLFKNLASGQILDLRAQFVRATGTTAADLVGLA